MTEPIIVEKMPCKLLCYHSSKKILNGYNLLALPYIKVSGHL